MPSSLTGSPRDRSTASWPRVRPGLLCAALLAVGCSPAPEGPVLLVTSGFTDEILLIDPMDGELLDTREMDVRPGERDEPHAVAVSPDGQHWYATLSHGEPTLWKYESAGDRLVGRVPLGIPGAGRIGISPDSRTAIIPDYWLGGTGAISQIVRVNLDDLTVDAPIDVCSAPHDAAWSPDGGLIGITCPLSDEIVVLDGASLSEVWRRQIPTAAAEEAGGAAVAPGNPRTQPMNLVWAPDGSGIFATLMRSGEVVRLDRDGSALTRLELGGGPTQLAVTPDGATLVVALRADFSAAVVETASLTLVRRVAIPDIAHPHGVALSPDGETAFLSHEGTIQTEGGVSAFTISDGTVLWSRAAGVFDLGIAWRR